MKREIAGAPQQGPGERYNPPPKHACEESNWQLPLDRENRLHFHARVYKRRIVHFSIEHQHRWDGEWKCVARIDSKDSIHLHLWDRWGTVLVDHKVITEIPPSPEGQQVVHNGFEPAGQLLEAKWEEHLRRWSE
ncbi:hypothetical protein [Aeromicrobium sp. 179-A 4D2 NHS]|uniref:DUF7718 family protein n=1 Tax=Aeromicrobium sp. 179-A 4D2 NHS TaxID=3142375 RepID=UPI0039A10D06